MKKKTNSKPANQKAPVSKALGQLMKDEDGFVSKETILKVGLSTVAALGMVGALTDTASGQINSYAHNNKLTTHAQNASVNQNCVAHTNITTHTSY